MQRRMMILLASALLLAGCGGPARQALSNALSFKPGAEDRGVMEAESVDAQGEGPGNLLDPDDHFPYHRRQPQPVPEGRQGQWLVVSNHNHSTYWDGEKPLTVMQQEAYLKNIDALVLTDHNTMRGCTSHEFLEPPPGLIMVKGMEWNAFRERGEPVVGHAGLLGLDGNQNIRTGAGLEEMLKEATDRHGTIIVNHPFCWNNAWTQAEPDPRAAGVEVWNGWWYRVNPIMHNDKALAWWEAALRKGRHLTAVSGTDNHGDWHGDVARVVNMVFAETPDQAGILKGIREGHVMIAASPTSARVYLEADADGDGNYEAIMGDQVARPANGKLSIRARVIGGDGKKVAFYTGKGRVAIADVKGKDATIPLAVTLGDGPDYVRAELRAHPHLAMSMTAITNPIYVSPAKVAPAN
jgi:predicted metal-dependent phosphoesterase TrpH